MTQIESQFLQLRLHGMSRVWQGLLETRRHHELSFTEGMELLLQAESEERTNRRTYRYEKQAKFRYQASLNELQYPPSRGLDKALVSQLATGDYIARGETLLITGNTGSGKSFLASALGHHGCSQGHRVVYHNMQKLSIKIKMARSDGSLIGFLDKLAKTHLLIIDDFGLARLDPQLSLDFMDIMEDRYAKNATIIASQIPVASWYDLFPEETVADAIMDRLAHGSYRIDLLGESLRKKR